MWIQFTICTCYEDSCSAVVIVKRECLNQFTPNEQEAPPSVAHISPFTLTGLLRSLKPIPGPVKVIDGILILRVSGAKPSLWKVEITFAFETWKVFTTFVIQLTEPKPKPNAFKIQNSN